MKKWKHYLAIWLMQKAWDYLSRELRLRAASDPRWESIVRLVDQDVKHIARRLQGEVKSEGN